MLNSKVPYFKQSTYVLFVSTPMFPNTILVSLYYPFKEDCISSKD